MNLKKTLVTATVLALSAFSLTACGGGDDSAQTKLVIAASPSPHAVILNYVKDNLAKEAGLEIEIKEYTDYVQPNEVLASGEVDANFFQTVPYLNDKIKENPSYKDFVPGKGVHLEPLAIYSDKVKDLKDLKDGATIGIINETVNQGRALKLLADKGLITLPSDESKQNVAAIENDSKANPRKFKFQEVEGPQLIRSLADVDVAVINGNFAIDAGRKPSDAIAIEEAKDNPAVNLLVWNKNSKKLDALNKLDELLHSDKVRDFIKETYADKSVIAAF